MKNIFQNNKRIAVVVVCFFVCIGIFYFATRSETPVDIKLPVPENTVFEEVPMTYFECMRTDERYNFQQRNRSDLKCGYLVSGGTNGQNFVEGDKEKFDKCEQMGDKYPTFVVSCGLTFYNQDYVFPKSFDECVKEKKGEFTTQVKPRCTIEIDASQAYDIEVANNLINQCIALGGSYSEQFGRYCYMEFTESNPPIQPQSIQNSKTCKITGQAVEGPYYRAEAPFRTSIAPANAGGEKLVIRGTVYSSDDCKTPLAGALVDIWHADANGAYDETSSEYRYRGRMLTDQNGHYQFETILPGYYRLGNGFRPRHIHFKVSKPNYRLLTTQLYFSGDPYLMPNDACLTCSSDDPTLIIPLKTDPDQEVYIRQAGIFDVILGK